MRLLLALAALLLGSAAHAGCPGDIASEADLLRANLCTFPDVAVVRIDSVQARDHDAAPGREQAWAYQVSVQDVLKGDLPATLCLLDVREAPVTPPAPGETFIASFDRGSDECAFVDVGGLLKATPALLAVAHGLAPARPEATKAAGAKRKKATRPGKPPAAAPRTAP